MTSGQNADVPIDVENDNAGMDISQMLRHIDQTLKLTFQQVDPWFEVPEDVLHFQPRQGWTTAQVLEHISLTNHFLLILIDKAAEKARKNVNHLDLQTLLQNPEFNLQGLEQVGQHGSFSWIRPEHMEPSGTADLSDVRQRIKHQVERCVMHLHELSQGEGLLYTTTMTVHGLGRLNVYEYIYFLAMHAKRHLTQMENNLVEFHCTAP